MAKTKLRATQIAGTPLNIGGTTDLTDAGFLAADGLINVKEGTGGVAQVILDAAGGSGTGSNKMVVVTGNTEVGGRSVTAILQLPIAAPGSPLTGDAYWDNVSEVVKVWNGTAWIELAADQKAISMFSQNGYWSATAGSFVEVTRCKMDIAVVLPGYYFQVFAWFTGGITSADIQLYDYTNFTPITTLNITNTAPAIAESTLQVGPAGLSEYSLRIRKNGGVPPDKVFLSCALLRA